MEQPSTPPPVPGAMLDILDRAFERHFLRITGAREGIHGLSMDLVSVACIVLLAEGAGASGEAGEPSPRPRKDLEHELEDMGLDDLKRLDHTLESMVRTGYVEIDDRGDLIPGKATLSMARLLDRAFPGMPGMNLVAYFVQTLDEVESGRKGPREALSQLDQMLRRHGSVPFGRKAKPARSEPPTPLRPARGAIRRASPPRPKRLEIPKGLSPSRPRESPNGEPSPPEAIHVEEPPVAETPAAPPFPGAEPDREPKDPPGEPSTEARLPPDEPPAPVETLGVPSASEPAPPLEAPSGAPDPRPVEEVVLDGPAPARSEPAPGEALSGAVESSTPAPDPEDNVENRIAAFEEDLSMQCPVCRKASIQVLQTAKGRAYYKCSEETCMFISWGRPHHIACPLCGNPFLVESAGRDGGEILKCPRATCRYREAASGSEAAPTASEGGGPPSESSRKPRRRVVRRKVRRKRR